MIETGRLSQIKIDRNKITLDEIGVKFNLTKEMSANFGKWLESQRKHRGYTQTELAERARVSKNYISLLEANKVNQPRLSSIDKIAKALDVPTDEARRQLVAGQVEVKQYSNEKFASLDFAYDGLKTDRSRERVDLLIEMLEHEIERIKREEDLQLAGHDASVDPLTGETTIHFKSSDVIKQSGTKKK